MGTDIQDNKCSWLVVQALQRANKEQKALLLANYAVDEEEKVRLIEGGVSKGKDWKPSCVT